MCRKMKLHHLPEFSQTKVVRSVAAGSPVPAPPILPRSVMRTGRRPSVSRKMHRHRLLPEVPCCSQTKVVGGSASASATGAASPPVAWTRPVLVSTARKQRACSKVSRPYRLAQLDNAQHHPVHISEPDASDLVPVDDDWEIGEQETRKPSLSFQLRTALDAQKKAEESLEEAFCTSRGLPIPVFRSVLKNTARRRLSSRARCVSSLLCDAHPGLEEVPVKTANSMRTVDSARAHTSAPAHACAFPPAFPPTPSVTPTPSEIEGACLPLVYGDL